VSDAGPQPKNERASGGGVWKGLYVAGGASFIYLGLHVIGEFAIFLAIGPVPANPTAEENLQIIAGNRIAFLALATLITAGAVLLAPAYVALYIFLRDLNRGLMTFAILMMGASIVFGMATGAIPAFAMARLSDSYAAATTDAERASVIAGAEAIMGIQSANPMYFLLLWVTTLLMSVVMRKSDFHKAVAYVGIVLGFLGIVSVIPGLFFVFLIAVPLGVAWFLAVGLKLNRISRAVPSSGRTDATR
jgi:hypothetical protein